MNRIEVEFKNPAGLAEYRVAMFPLKRPIGENAWAVQRWLPDMGRFDPPEVQTVRDAGAASQVFQAIVAEWHRAGFLQKVRIVSGVGKVLGHAWGIPAAEEKGREFLRKSGAAFVAVESMAGSRLKVVRSGEEE